MRPKRGAFSLRPWLLMGGQMGWTAEQVRAAHLDEIMACHAGWLMARGIAPKAARQEPLTREWLRGLEARAAEWEARRAAGAAA